KFKIVSLSFTKQILYDRENKDKRHRTSCGSLCRDGRPGDSRSRQGIAANSGKSRKSDEGTKIPTEHHRPDPGSKISYTNLRSPPLSLSGSVLEKNKRRHFAWL